MYDVELAKNSKQQNIEIIYNNNRVYFKTVKNIFKHDFICAFPSKDLEISLGLQFIPINPGILRQKFKFYVIFNGFYS